MNKILLSFAVICFIVLSAEARSDEEKIKCKVCSQYSGNTENHWGKCKDAKDKGQEHTCPDNYHSCMKTVKDNGEIMRGCASRKVKEDACVEDKDGKMVCHCTGDYCNGSKMNALYRGILFLPIVAAIITYK